MGMFDNVRCEVPLPDGYEGFGLQTKDFDCMMATITITKDGRLVTDGRDWWVDKESAEPRDLQFHGVFRFYGSEGRHATDTWKWHEYLAKFTDGRLVEIALAPEWSAQGTEAGTAKTEGLGPKDDGPVAEGDAP